MDKSKLRGRLGQTLAVLLTFLLAFQSLAIIPKSGTVQAATSFLTASGKNLVYNGQNITLKGVNFDNIPALGADIGTGKIESINHNEADYQKLSEMGGNTARLGLDFGWYKNDKTKFYQYMDQHVAWAKKHNVWLIFNMFTTPGNCYEGYGNYCGIWSSSSEKTELKNFWVEMANRYKAEPAVAGYDLLNEPTPPGPGWSATWNTLAQEIINAVRTVNTTQLIFVESTSDAYFATKFTGGNIVYQVHFYGPIAITHTDEGKGITYPGYAKDWDGRNLYWDKSAFMGQRDAAQDIREIYSLNWASNNNVPIFVGEWGSRGTYPGYEQYVKDVAELFKDWGVNHTYYTWRHDENYWKWGMFYPRTAGDFSRPDQKKIDAVKISLTGAIKPDFGIGGGIPDGGGTPTPVTCTSFTYSAWGTCTNGNQSRTVSTSLPTGCTGGIPALTQGCTVAPPPTTPPSSSYTFYKGINFSGDSVVIDGKNWSGEDGKSYKLLTSKPFDDQEIVLKPSVDAVKSSMLKRGIYNYSGTRVGIPLPNGSYQVYLYVVEDFDTTTFDLTAEGASAAKGIVLKGGEWKKIGPINVDLTDGVLNLKATNVKGLAMFSGVEIYKK